MFHYPHLHAHAHGHQGCLLKQFKVAPMPYLSPSYSCPPTDLAPNPQLLMGHFLLIGLLIVMDEMPYGNKVGRCTDIIRTSRFNPPCQYMNKLCLYMNSNE